MRTLKHGGDIIKYTVVKSKRIKTSEIFVDARSVLIRTPQNKPDNEVAQLVRSKASWIAKKQREYQRLQSQFSNPTFESGSTLPYQGRHLTLQIITGHRNNAIRLVNGEFLATFKSKKVSKRQVKELYESWLMEKAKSILESKVRKHAREIRVKPRRVVIKKLQRRWGSATKNNIINLNFLLVKAPEEVIDYVIVHELCHLRVRDHSYRFWDLLHSFMPNYEEKVEWLKSNSPMLV